MILALCIVSVLVGGVGLVTGIMAWVMGGKDLKQIDAGVMDPDGRSNTHGGIICGIIGTILGGLDVACGVAALFFNLYDAAGL